MKTIIFYYSLMLCTISAYSQEHIPNVTFPISGGAFFYHPASKALLLAGGSSVIPDSIQSDVWKWDGKVWTKITAKGPGSRRFFMGALNTKTGELNFYGGMDASYKPKRDMWYFNGKRWTKMTTNDIGTHDHHNMVYMNHLDAFLVYGGNINGYPNFDSTTWILKNGQFTKMNIPGPGPRWHYGLVYDKLRKKAVLYGGGEKPDEHWEFDGVKWTKIITKENPGRRLYHQMVYNDDSKTIILHGGWTNQNPRDAGNYTPRTTWEWNGTAWKKIAEEHIHARALGYDANRKVIVALGYTGNPENSNMALWEMENGKWQQVMDYPKWSPFEIVTKQVEQFPNDFLALAKYADMLEWQTKQYAEAEAAYKKLEVAYPQNTDYWNGLVSVLSAQGKIKDAQVYLEKISKAGLLNKSVYIRLAGRLRQENKITESIIYLIKITELEPVATNFYNLGCAYALSGNKDKAFALLNKAANNGFTARNYFENDGDLASLKNDNRWATLMQKLDAPFNGNTPYKRAHHEMVYDEVNKSVLLIGGSTPLNGGNSFKFFNDIWKYNSNGWSKIVNAGDERSGIRLAYDSKRNKLYSFGGFTTDNQSSGQLRVLENNEWKLLSDIPEMKGAESGFAYDASRDKFIAFGGSAGRGLVNNTTWEWDGTAWKKMEGQSPEGRQAFAMIYDSKRKRTVLFGGGGTTPDKKFGDTWEFDGTAWTKVSDSGPGERRAPGYTYDSKRGMLIIFGGSGKDGIKGDTWGWEGAAWKKLADTGPAPRMMGYMAYDKDRDRIVLFGGRLGWPNDADDTWEWDGVKWNEVK